MGSYRSFSTIKYNQFGQNFTTYDIDTVKQDLTNHLFTIKGERRMMPQFGTRIPIMVFEPGDQASIDIIKTDVLEVINYDPRVRMIEPPSIFFLPEHHTVVCRVVLEYIDFGITEPFDIILPGG